MTVVHSKTKDIPGILRDADIIIAAIGRAEMVRGDWIKPGAAVIDVGINGIPKLNPDGTQMISQKTGKPLQRLVVTLTLKKPKKLWLVL